ncbi:MAG: 16S rRNA processing protein RimM [Candidatus Krumholzibacteriia bacterium]|jgi:16S rRNA processing protein RimM
MNDAKPTENHFVVIGELVKAIGLKGEIKFYPLLNYFEELLNSKFLVWADGSPATVSKHRQAGSCRAIKVPEVHDRNGSEAMVGRRLGFMSHNYMADDFPKPVEGLPFRWLGREVETVGGDAIGIVDEVRVAGAGYMLVLNDSEQDGNRLMIPALAPILQPEDGLTGTLIVDPPEGLFDVQRG